MTWTREKPTQPGWYWWRTGILCNAVKINFDRNETKLFLEKYGDPLHGYFVENLGGEWAGPLVEPGG
jgi:hypothetical protein